MSTPAEKITALVPVVPTGDTPLEAHSLEQAMKLASTFAPSVLLPTHLRNRPADVLITILHGRELGLTPMQALNGIFVVEGKPSVSAQMAVALVKRRADVCEYFTCVESSETRAVYETKRRGEPQAVRMEFTLEEAKRAGLTSKKGAWQTYPKVMLRNRCSMHLARDIYPDLVAGVYDQDEIDDFRPSAPVPSFVAPPPPSAAAIRPAPTDGNDAPAASDCLTVETGKATIAAAATLADLQAITPRIPAAIKESLKEAFKARWRELETAEKRKAEQTVAAPPTAEREPGSEDMGENFTPEGRCE